MDTNQLAQTGMYHVVAILLHFLCLLLLCSMRKSLLISFPRLFWWVKFINYFVFKLSLLYNQSRAWKDKPYHGKENMLSNFVLGLVGVQRHHYHGGGAIYQTHRETGIIIKCILYPILPYTVKYIWCNILKRVTYILYIKEVDL